MKHLFRLFFTVSLISFTFATTHDVSIVNFAFEPSALSITVGDTVKWTNNGTNPHTTTATDGSWDSGTISVGGTFIHAFVNIGEGGSFDYACNFHSSMQGNITASTSQDPDLCPPSNLSAGGGDTSVYLVWDAPSFEGGISVQVEIFTDNYPSETSWDIVDGSGNVVDGDNNLSGAGILLTWELSLSGSQTYTFTIYDSFGDGICCDFGEGYYNLYVDGTLEASGGAFLASESTSFTTPSDDSDCGTFTDYKIYDGTGAIVGTSNGTSFTDTGLTNGTEYCYTVKALYEEGESAATNEACATPAEMYVATLPLTEDFEGGAIPVEWSTENISGNDDWMIGDAITASSDFVIVPDHTLFAFLNDDASGSTYDTNTETILWTPFFDVSDANSVFLVSFAEYMQYYGDTGTILLQAGTAGDPIAINVTEATTTAWQMISIDITSLVTGVPVSRLGFYYSDGGAWAGAWCVDDLTVNAYSMVTISGNVSSALTSGPLEGAMVEALETATGLEYGATTDAAGDYSFSGLSGIYDIEASAEGHQDGEVEDADASNGLVQDFVLDPDLPGVILEASDGGDKDVDLVWHMGEGSGPGADPVGSWDLTFDWYCDGADGTAQIDFYEDGTGSAGGTPVNWVAENGTIDLEGYLCEGMTFDYNFYFMFPGYGTFYYFMIEEDYGEGPQDSDGTSTSDGWALMSRIGRDVSFKERYYEHQATNTVSKLNPILNPATPNELLYYVGVHDIYVPEETEEFSWFTSRDTTVTSFEVYRDTAMIADVNGSDSTYTDADTSLMYDVEYCYTVNTKWYVSEYDATVYGEPSNEACAVPRLSGDVDGDHAVTVDDIILTIEFILEIEVPDEYEFGAADVNDDGELNILDVVRMVDIIIENAGGGRIAYTGSDAEAILSVTNTFLPNEGDAILNIGLEYSDYFSGLQYTLNYNPDILTLGEPILSNSLNAAVFSKEVEPGRITVVLLNLVGDLLNVEDDLLMTFPVNIVMEGTSASVNFDFDNPVVAGANGESVTVTARSTSLNMSSLPETYSLHQNYPNPFNPTTKIQFDLIDAGKATVGIYNLLGQEIVTLVSSKFEAGYHEIVWDGKNGSGEMVSAGVYIYSLSVNDFHQTKKMILLK
tara:strand:+ start:8073 stop:11435 length:3363 start_codon:yes stop_codon:yes gene_type:complete